MTEKGPKVWTEYTVRVDSKRGGFRICRTSTATHAEDYDRDWSCNCDHGRFNYPAACYHVGSADSALRQYLHEEEEEVRPQKPILVPAKPAVTADDVVQAFEWGYLLGRGVQS